MDAPAPNGTGETIGGLIILAALAVAHALVYWASTTTPW
jgi:uncharacterized protein HemX